MSSLAGISGRDCTIALRKVGFYLKRQHGSHLILRRDHQQMNAYVRQRRMAPLAFDSHFQRHVRCFPPVGPVLKDRPGIGWISLLVEWV